MNFFKVFFFAFVCLVALVSVSAAPAPEPKWKIFKKIEKMGRRVRDGIIKAGPAIAVIGQAKGIGK